MKYNKLIRDRIPEIIAARGQTAITHIANNKEYWEKLLEKFSEEVKEFAESSSEEEMVDIFEVLYALCDAKGIDREHLEVVRKEKAEKRGTFKKKFILDETK